jgi:hypothetical protein
MRVLGTKLARFAVMALMGVGTASALYADNFVVTYDAAGTTTPVKSDVCSSQTGAQCWIGQQNFDSGAPTAGSVFPTYTSEGGLTGNISGTYSSGLVVTAADQFGGAGGTGSYADVTGPGSYTLTLIASDLPGGVNYFGLWFSALDLGNKLQFYDGSQLEYTFGPAQFISLVGSCSTAGGFCGNPSGTYVEQDGGQQYAFLNFYDYGGEITSITFSEAAHDGGFESDNHTVGYMNPIALDGTIIPATPEPGTFALFGSGLLGLAGFARRRIGRRA